ncbi:MAG: TonB-dependent receptor [Cytophagaceae bacterium]|jgi:hypothetical protein|nr:TonB-dependent receptor [Cytophagaceae bacterium]
MRYALRILLVLAAFSMAAQSVVRGYVKNDQDSAVVFAKVLLNSVSDSLFKRQQWSNEEGFFIFQQVPPGRYFIEIASLETQYFSSSEFTVADSLVSLSYRLSPVHTTKEVVVNGNKELVRVEAGKMIVNVEQSVSNAGLSALEVLRKSPGISIDQDGNIQLNGKNGVLIMIDDKAMYLGADQLMSLLRSIPAEQIKEIEIITSPSAKYDASGSAGIVNLRLKKIAYEGLTGRLYGSFGYGRFHKATAGVNLTHKKKKHTLHLNYQYGNRKGFNYFGTDRINDNLLIQNNTFHNVTTYTLPTVNQNLQITGDRKLNRRSTLTFDLNNTLNTHRWRGDSEASLSNRASSLINLYKGIDQGKQINLNSYTSVGFQHSLDTLGSQVSGYLAFNKNVGFKDKAQDIQTFDAAGQLLPTPFLFNQNNDNHSNQYVGQLDVLKKKKSGRLEVGMKYNHLEFFNPFLTIIQQSSVSETRNRYYYQEQVAGSYAQTSGKFRKRWTYQVGLRMENTWMRASFSEIDTSFSRTYTNLFPSGNISFKKNEKTSWSLSYSRRITRPSPEQLNPIINYLDPYSGFGGDGYMRPQLTNSAELSYTMGGGTFVSSLTYSYITAPIVWLAREDKQTGIFIGGMRNMDAQYSYGISGTFQRSLRKWWNCSVNLHTYNNIFIGDAGFGKIDNQLIGWTSKTTQLFTLPGSYKLELSGSYESPSSYAFAYNYYRWQLNAALQKQFFAKKVLFKIAANDIFRSYFFNGNSSLGPLQVENFYRWDNRTVIFSFHYKFGNPFIKQE